MIVSYDQKKQQQFNEWAGANYERIKQQVMLCMYWNEDVFQDTYIECFMQSRF